MNDDDANPGSYAVAEVSYTVSAGTLGCQTRTDKKFLTSFFRLAISQGGFLQARS